MVPGNAPRLAARRGPQVCLAIAQPSAGGPPLGLGWGLAAPSAYRLAMALPAGRVTMAGRRWVRSMAPMIIARRSLSTATCRRARGS